MTVIKVRNTTVYDAILSTDPEAEEIILGWMREAGMVQPGDSIDFEPLKADHAWALRHPDGGVAFAHPAVFVVEFEDVESEDFGDHTQLDLGFDPDAVIAEEEAKRGDQG